MKPTIEEMFRRALQEYNSDNPEHAEGQLGCVNAWHDEYTSSGTPSDRRKWIAQAMQALFS